MRILFDHGTPSGISKALTGHDVTEAIERGSGKPTLKYNSQTWISQACLTISARK